MSPPRFIVFEGPDGAGKTTCAGLLAQRLGADLLTTPPPGVRRYRDDKRAVEADTIERLASLLVRGE